MSFKLFKWLLFAGEIRRVKVVAFGKSLQSPVDYRAPHDFFAISIKKK
jgi:hypothetical protein